MTQITNPKSAFTFHQPHELGTLVNCARVISWPSGPGMWSAAASLPALPGELCAAPAPAGLSLLSTQHGLPCSGSSSFPTAEGSSHPHCACCVCVPHPRDCCPSLGTAHHNWCTFLVPLGLQEASRLEPSLSLHYMRHLHTMSAGCPGFAPLCSLRCCPVVQRSFCVSPWDGSSATGTSTALLMPLLLETWSGRRAGVLWGEAAWQGSPWLDFLCQPRQLLLGAPAWQHIC